MKKFILVVLTIFAICCVATADESEITRVMKKFKIIPDLVCGSVPQLLKVTYDNRISVDMGNEISPFQARHIPAVDWNADENSYYTITFSGPDAPSPGDPFLGEFLTWLVGNIHGKTINSGKVLAEYFAPSPPRGALLNRVVFLVYKQPGELEFDEKPINNYTYVGRPNFSSKEFSAKYGLGDPVAGNFFLTKFDNFVLEIYKQLNCCFEFDAPNYHYT